MDFDLEIRIGAGAFVCGEETSLLASIEGKRGEPRQKPPFPFEKGLFDCPTIINNVETLANVAPIILNGAEWYRQFGTEKSSGTKCLPWPGILSMRELSKSQWVFYWVILYIKLAAELWGARNLKPSNPAILPAVA